MSPGFAVFILMNNYFHDVSTAMLFCCGIVLMALQRPLQRTEDAAVLAYFGRIARGMERIAWFSLTWIIVSGILRAATFRTFEWANAVEKHHETGLLVKYAIAFTMTVIGLYFWSRASRRGRKITAGR